jgi:RNA polymerase sigma factor (sigma-70 family)
VSPALLIAHEVRNSKIERALPRIWGIARSFHPPLPPGIDVEDLVHEAVACMVYHIDRGLPWSRARARGAMLDVLKRAAAGRPGMTRGEMPSDVASTAPNPEELAIHSDRRRILQRNAANLPPREQALLRLASHGASGQRIAQELRVNTRRVRKLRAGVVARLARAVAA